MKQLKKATLAAAALIFLGQSASQAAIIVNLPTATAAGSITVTADIAFTITTAGGVRLAVFDEWVASDGSWSPGPPVGSGFGSATPDLRYSLNSANPTTVGWIGVVDNFASTFGAVTANDGYLGFAPIAIPVVVGDIFTLKAATYTLPAGSLPADFNPQAAQTFTGNAFLASPAGVRLTPNAPVGAIPEPTSLLSVVLACAGLLSRRRRTA